MWPEVCGFMSGLLLAQVTWLILKVYYHFRPVNSRAPGLSEHALPFGQTEARAKRTIERPPNKSASAHECGAAPPPRAPEPSAARVG